MDLVNEKYELATFIKEKQTIEKIVKRVEEIPEYGLLGKHNINVILYITNLLENEIFDNKKKQYDKKEICVKILQRLYHQYNQDELKNLRDSIQYLWNSKQIKKISFFKFFYKKVSHYLKKKIF